MKFLVDMNLSPQWVDFLVDAGYEAVHWSSLGAPDAPDVELLEMARQGGYVILTHDLDFGSLLAVGGLSTPSVIQFRAQAVLPHALGAALLAAVLETESHIARGALVTVDAYRHRVSLLPLGD